MRDPGLSSPEYKSSWRNISRWKRLEDLKGVYFNVQRMYGCMFSNKIHLLTSYFVDNVNIPGRSQVHHEDLKTFD